MVFPSNHLQLKEEPEEIVKQLPGEGIFASHRQEKEEPLQKSDHFKLYDFKPIVLIKYFVRCAT